jgi:hypothetical protein
MIKMARSGSPEDRILASLKRGDTLAVLTAEIFKAAKKQGINLDKAFDAKKAGQKAFNDKLRIALGICEEKEMGGRRLVVYCAKSQHAFRSSNLNKKSDDHKYKEAVRSNFAHDLKLATQVAAGLIDMNANVAMGQEIGTLAISGPGVVKEFGAERVLLKPKQARSKDETGITRMSYSGIAAIAAKKRRAILRPRVDSRRAIATLKGQINSLVEALRRRHTLTAGEKDALVALLPAIKGVLRDRS